MVVGGFVLASAAATEAADALGKAVGARQLRVPPMANGLGLEVTGVLPSHARYDYRHMLAGGAKALLLSEPRPGQRPGQVAERLRLRVARGARHVHDATAQIAHVVLPAKSGYEKDGTTLSLEGRYLPVRAAPVDAGEARDLTGVVKALGEAFGQRLEGRSVRSARRVLRKQLGFEPADLDRLGLLQPLPKVRAGVSVTTDDEPTGGALRVPTMARPEYLAYNPHLRAALGDPALRLHPDDAAERDLRTATGDRPASTACPRRLRVVVERRRAAGRAARARDARRTRRTRGRRARHARGRAPGARGGLMDSAAGRPSSRPCSWRPRCSARSPT
jgi:hypothetical protein